MRGANRALAQGHALQHIGRRKTWRGVLAARDHEMWRYGGPRLIRAAPPATTIGADHAGFKLRAVGRIGVVPMELEGRPLADGTIVVDNAVIATQAAGRRAPRPLDLGRRAPRTSTVY